MTIKEAETKTGISKQNIRFYEKKGLLAPCRNQENSYREYTEADVALLLQIKMLRKLDVSVENIQKILNGESQDAVIRQHLDLLLNKKNRLESAIAICRYLLRPDAERDAPSVLSKMERMEQQGGRFAAIVHDYKKISNAEKKRSFQFEPDFLVMTPGDFTRALCEYCEERGLDLNIVKEGMYPKFEIDGVMYEAYRDMCRYGTCIHCKAQAGQIEQEFEDVDPKRRKTLRLICRAAQCLVLPLSLFLILGAANFAAAVAGFLFFLLLELAERFLLRGKDRND